MSTTQPWQADHQASFVSRNTSAAEVPAHNSPYWLLPAQTDAPYTLSFAQKERGDVQELAAIYVRLSPSSQRLVRELIWKLCRLEQLTIPEDYDSRLDYEACVARWLQHLSTAGFSPNTCVSYARHVRRLLTEYPHPSKANIDAFLARMVASGKKPATVGLAIHAFRNFFTFLVDSELAATNPAAKLRALRRPLEIRQAPRPEDVQKLLDAPKSPRHQLMLLLMVDCGLRLSEVIKARISMVDMDSRTITITGKGNKSRQTPFSQTTAHYIQAQLKDLKESGYTGPWLFPGIDPSKPAAPRSVDGYLASLCQRLGIKPSITPHHLRHFFATQMLSRGANLKATSTILGHASPSTTANVYWHLVDRQEITDQHSKFSPLKGVVCPEEK